MDEKKNHECSPWRFCVAPLMDWTDRLEIPFFYKGLAQARRAMS